MRRRRSIRLSGYDYTQPGVYFVTLCTQNRECFFGEIINGKMILNEYGKIVDACWAAIPEHFNHVMLDTYVVMPNHVHGIITIMVRNGSGVGARHAVPLPSDLSSNSFESFGKPVRGSIPTVIRSFKSAVAKRVNQIRDTPGISIWQRNFHERVIRDERELNQIREYVNHNPLSWDLDRNNPENIKMEDRVS